MQLSNKLYKLNQFVTLLVKFLASEKKPQVIEPTYSYLWQTFFAMRHLSANSDRSEEGSRSCQNVNIISK